MANAKSVIERLAAAGKEKNEEGMLVAGLELLEIYLTTQERIAAALEKLAK